jgi:hypothetical protein
MCLRQRWRKNFSLWKESLTNSRATDQAKIKPLKKLFQLTWSLVLLLCTSGKHSEVHFWRLRYTSAVEYGSQVHWTREDWKGLRSKVSLTFSHLPVSNNSSRPWSDGNYNSSSPRQVIEARTPLLNASIKPFCFLSWRTSFPSSAAPHVRENATEKGQEEHRSVLMFLLSAYFH